MMNSLAVLEEAVLTCLQQHPELKDEKNHVNMWDYRNAQEDVDDSYDEEEYYNAMDDEADGDEEDWQ